MTKQVRLNKCQGNICLELTPLKVRQGQSVFRGTITSALHDPCKYCDQATCYHSCDESTYSEDENSETEEEVADRRAFNGAVDGVESLILSLACNGVDVESDTFQDAVNGCLDAIGNNME